MNNDLINNNKYKDITELHHQQEQIPVNKNAMNALAAFAAALRAR